MFRTIFCLAVPFAMAGLSFSTARAQTLTLEVDLADLETWITNDTSSDIAVRFYSIRSPSPIFDPVNWRSISDTAAVDSALVASTLGSGALSYSEFIVRPTWLIELNFPSAGVWQPGTRWSIGFPFGTSPDTFDPDLLVAQFEYAEFAPVAITGPIVFIPVPEPGAVPMALVTLLSTLLIRRRRGSRASGASRR
jgi:hypothetical protein